MFNFLFPKNAILPKNMLYEKKIYLLSVLISCFYCINIRSRIYKYNYLFYNMLFWNVIYTL